MSTNGIALDGWSYLLYSLETFLYVVFVPLIIVFFYICIVQRNLHSNFRLCLFMAGVGYLGIDLLRITSVIVRLSSYGNSNAAVLEEISLFQISCFDFAMFGFLCAVIERGIVSVFPCIYNLRYSVFVVGVLLCSINVLLTGLLMCMYRYNMVRNLRIYLMVMNAVVVLLCIIALVAIIKFNASEYRKRHDTMMELAVKYRLDENIRSGKYLISIAVNDLICRVVFIALVAYSIVWKIAPIGSDETHFYHSYDLLFAYQRIFAALAFALQSGKFRQLINRGNRARRIMDNQAKITETYFGKLRETWA